MLIIWRTEVSFSTTILLFLFYQKYLLALALTLLYYDFGHVNWYLLLIVNSEEVFGLWQRLRESNDVFFGSSTFFFPCSYQNLFPHNPLSFLQIPILPSSIPFFFFFFVFSRDVSWWVQGATRCQWPQARLARCSWCFRNRHHPCQSSQFIPISLFYFIFLSIRLFSLFLVQSDSAICFFGLFILLEILLILMENVFLFDFIWDYGLLGFSMSTSTFKRKER